MEVCYELYFCDRNRRFKQSNEYLKNMLASMEEYNSAYYKKFYPKYIMLLAANYSYLNQNEKSIELPARETNVLRELLIANGRIISKPRMIETLSSFDEDISENAIEQYISRLRKRLVSYGLTIKAARGLGYYLHRNSILTGEKQCTNWRYLAL